MEPLSIEILNPKALQLIMELQKLNLIRITKGLVKQGNSASVVTEAENDEQAWKDIAAKNFLKGYSDDEPDYTLNDIKEPNPEYKAWKEK
ncbi:MAG: hypothetical protein JWQ38_1396 [Flavipsychrobacter sp.]|nr:hypothetical protein [Flavipsychrobacter sp.]